MSDSSRRVVITGMGLVSPLGNAPDKLFAALMAGESGVRRFERLSADVLPTPFGAEARDFNGEIEDFGPLDKQIGRNIRKGLKLMCREIEMGTAAAQLAIADAGLSEEKRDADRTGVIYGSDYIMTTPDEFIAGIKRCIDENGDFQFDKWGSDGLAEVTPLWLLKYLPNMPASHIAIYNDLRGPNNSITQREASGMLAVGEAYTTITRGAADVVIAGSTGSRVHPVRTVHVMLQEQMADGAAEPTTASRPFDLNRTGAVLGEGAGAVVLETIESATARGANVLGEIAGRGSATCIDRQGAAHYDRAIAGAMRAALRDAGMSPSEIGHIHAHGLSSRHCDRQEAAAIAEVFGDNAPPVTAAKSFFGNLGAGGGMVEMIASVKSLADGRLFPILNYETPDPDCPINAALGMETPAGDSFITVNVTPQGQASAVIVKVA